VLGQELRKARIAAKMTQEQVAAGARLSREYVSQLERGRYQPTVEVLMRLAAAMSTRGWRILRRVEEGKPRKPSAR
jgi:transcriptional regulator with XRE-family HTH domain